MTLREIAQKWSKLGLNIVPVKLSLDSDGKKDVGCFWRWQTDPYPNFQKLNWYGANGFAVVLGNTPQGWLICVDCDHDTGYDAYSVLVKVFPDLSATYIERTPNGFHFFVYIEKPIDATNVSLKTKNGLELHVNGLIFMAPSRYEGGTYEVYSDTRIFRDPNFYQKFQKTFDLPKTQKIARELEKTIVEGQRNEMLTSLAGTLRRRGLTSEEIFTALKAINEKRCIPPLKTNEVESIAESMNRYDAEDPYLNNPKKQIIITEEELKREVNLKEISEILSATIKEDQPVKLITFLTTLLTYTDQDQQNLCFKGESAGGKSYNALEVAEYFPEKDVIKIAYSSPTAFFHDKGTWDPENKTVIVNLRQKILIFLDQPHDQLLQRLRPLLSHDNPTLLYKITDKREKSGTRTKYIILEGYPTVIFCTAKMNMDEQERTRMFLLSPETKQEKLKESLFLLARKLGDRDKFKKELNTDEKRAWLRKRIQAIKATKIENIIIENPEKICTQFITNRQDLIPRHQRDFPRLLALIKAHALLNCFMRTTKGKNIVANETDIQAGFQLYEKIVKPNEMGLSPEVYEIFKNVIKPSMTKQGPDDTPHISRKEILECYFHKYRRPLSYKRLDKELLPALTGAGIIYEDADPNDRRCKLVYLAFEEPEEEEKEEPNEKTDEKINTPVLGGKAKKDKDYCPLEVDKEGAVLPHPSGVFISENSSGATKAAERLGKLREQAEERREA